MSGSVPRWLLDRLQSAGGSVPFRTYMEWALHDPHHGYYGSGRARIGTQGDFATSPSLGGEFAALLLRQLIEWLEQIPAERLSLVEAGPGEGHLIQQLVQGLTKERPDLAARLEIVLVEPNPGMVAIQRRVLEESTLPVRWTSWADLGLAPVKGVVVAHEVLDALPVDRVLWDGQQWRWQHVALEHQQLALVAGPALDPKEWARISRHRPAERDLAPGWCTEVHSGLRPWLEACAHGLQEGILLVVDYALEAWRYNAPLRSNGTLMAYRQQLASGDVLQQPGEWDLTAHLCVDAVLEAAESTGWTVLGQRRQGEALLALGLAQRLAALGESPPGDLSEVLRRREQLLRLVDPMATGDFRWLVLGRSSGAFSSASLRSLCLSDPPPPEPPTPTTPQWLGAP
ncbi:MAG: class I SAM-dependent methyltransferase [Cyanobium sp.]